MFGGPPNTTYGENIGVLAITRIFSVFVIGGAAVFAMLFAFIGKLEALIASVPTPVMGGVSILLFGIIASAGLRMLVDSKVDRAIRGLAQQLLTGPMPERLKLLRRMESVRGVTAVSGARIQLVHEGNVEVAAVAWRRRHDAATGADSS